MFQEFKLGLGVTWLFLLVLIVGTKTEAAVAVKLPPPLKIADFGTHPTGVDSNARKTLGGQLFWDKILSGNNNISCGTCHHPFFRNTDGLSLGIGTGGRGLGTLREPYKGEVQELIPRRVPPLYNLGHKSLTVFFADGRVEADPSHPAGFKTPAGNELPSGLESALAATCMFPSISAREMLGKPGENEVADAPNKTEMWRRYVARIMSVQEYRDLFKSAYPKLRVPEDVTFVHVANALADFVGTLVSVDSPFDRYLGGDMGAMSPNAIKGMKIFYGKAKCATCHSGPLMTDQGFYSVGIPQIGPGKGDGFLEKEDYGRERVTKNLKDRYRFRTPPLRNVATLFAFGHSGAYANLDQILNHFENPTLALERYGKTVLRANLTGIHPSIFMADFPNPFEIYRHTESRKAIQKSIEIKEVVLTQKERALLVDFLHALTDPLAQSKDFQTLPAAFFNVPSRLRVMD